MGRLEPLLAKVCSVHGNHHHELWRLQSLFRALCHELTSHLLKEEQMLFPYIAQMEEALDRQQALPIPLFRTVRNPVRMLMLEHDYAGDVWREIRHLTNNYRVPSDGCLSYQTLFQALAAFERDLHQHIHLENNLLFPRAVKMEGAI
jgi:regulator of cell morphogenesis and NO signaling